MSTRRRVHSTQFPSRGHHSFGAALLLLCPTPALAHSFGQVYSLPVPFWLYAWAASAALIVSFVIAGIFLSGKRAGAAPPAPRPWRELPRVLLRGLQLASLAGLALCIATGWFGTPNSYANFNMTFFWIVFVLGFAYFTALVGDLYALINPWRLLSEPISRVWPRFAEGRLRYPRRLAYWPALALYGVFIWIELFGGTRPFSLATILAGYTVLNLLAVGLIGARAWFEYGEVFSVLLRLIARLAPIEFDPEGGPAAARWRWRAPGAGALGHEGGHFTLMLFVLFMLSATAFDGLHEARPWVQFFWQTLYQEVFAPWLGGNLVQSFPVMRAVYQAWQSAWLLLSPFTYLGLYMATIYAVTLLTRRQFPAWVLAGRFVHSLLPIVLAYHVTHYYTLIQTQGVKIIALISDPFGYGWNLFGTVNWMRGVRIPDTATVWHAQVGLILAGHIASVVLAHLEALRIFPDRKTATLSQLPMLALMVAFTVFGLWILSLPFGAPGPG